MPTGNKNKTTNSGSTKKSGTKNSKQGGAGVSNVTPGIKARDRAKDMDSKRRSNIETFDI